MIDESTSFVPVSEALPEGSWPESLLGSAGGSLLDVIAYESGEVNGDLSRWSVAANLRVMDEIAFPLPLMGGMALVIGSGPIEVDLDGRFTDWTAEITASVAKFRLPRSVFQPVIEQGGKLVADPDPNHFVEIALPFTIVLDSTGAVDVIWPGERSSPLVLPKCQILPGVVIGGELSVAFEGGKFKAADSTFTRYDPESGAATPLSLVRFHADTQCFALSWTEPDINAWLAALSPQLVDESAPASSEVTLRVVFGDPVREIRLDWALSGTARTFAVPGFKVQTPNTVGLSLVLGAGEPDLSHAALALTFDGAASELAAFSDFAWERGADREVHGTEGSNDQPLIRFTAKPNKKVSLVLMDWDIGSGGLPRFFRQLEAPIAPLDLGNASTLTSATPWVTKALDANDWAVTFQLTAPKTLPFLRGGSGAEEQFISIDPSTTIVDVRLLEHLIHVEIGILVKIGSLDLATAIPIDFNWETFAFSVDHELGLDIVAPIQAIAPTEEFLGLRWKFSGGPARNRNGDLIPGRWHFLTLSTKDHNYTLQQAPGAVFEVEYTQLSEEGVGFAISGFSLSPAGISLAATVIDRPARLNGIDTRFRFSGTQLVIKENRITDFTLAGSGPLPPALVGDATADIALQMAQRDGKLRLVSGGARLKAKILDCKGTRFRFSIDAIGLQFVYETKFHLYFTLTGSAQFVLASGDDADGALALLPKIKIDLVDCPLTGDASVIAKHVQFLVDLPRPLSFNFLGAFEMELRGIGFVPQAEVFDGDGAMLLTGQLKFAQGAGDTADSRTDFHKLYVGLPKKGSFIPRIHFANLPVHLNFGSAFQLNGCVDFVDGNLEKGFTGEGTLAIQGLPTFAAAFAFLRVRRDETAPWVRAWFLYAEVRKISFQIPVVQMYIREVGLGFGYRYTIASIRAADQANDMRQLLQELTKLSRTQGDLSKRDRWSVDLEQAGEDPRWTLALRAMISQTSAQTSPLRYEESAEKDLSCLFLLDAVIALRSDLTFFMAARGWLFANYNDYVTDYKGIRGKPVVSGFVLLSPRHKRLLAHVASNPNGQLGPHPQLPKFVQTALSKSQFSGTLLVEPGLLHTELGWPNQLRWADKYGPLNAEFRGGLLFRVSRDELVTGVSFLARATLKIDAGVSLGIVGVRVSASAAVAFGARYIGLLSLRDPLGSSALYGGIGIEAMIRFAIEFWLRIKLWRIKITKTFRFSFTLDFTAGLEFGFVGVSTSGIGLRGTGHLAVSVMGRRFALSARLGFNEGAVATALARTQHVLKYGLEATEVESIPGLPGTGTEAASMSASPAQTTTLAASTTAYAGESLSSDTLTATATLPVLTFHAPGYTLFVVRGAAPTDASHFVLFPAGERPSTTTPGTYDEEPGFLPVPPTDESALVSDFLMRVPKSASETWSLDQYDPISKSWRTQVSSTAAAPVEFSWKSGWDEPIEDGEQAADAEGNPIDPPLPKPFRLRDYLRNAFVLRDVTDPSGATIEVPAGDPDVLPAAALVEDPRVHDPSDDAFESAVRGAMEQFRGAPFFRRDPNSAYETFLQKAYRDDTTIYHASGEVPSDPAVEEEMQRQQQAHELRGLVVHDMVADLRDYAGAVDKTDPKLTEKSVAFATGLVFRLRPGPDGIRPAWLEDLVTGGPTLAQRVEPTDTFADAADAQPVQTFNVKATDFASNPPRFDRVQQLTDASTIALAWDLVWSEPPRASATTGQRDPTPAQGDPEHHLLHYQVRRRALDGGDREVVYTLKGADTLHREEDASGSVLKRLRRRFQLVDHFSDETAEDLAALPELGKQYLYSITPVDFAGNAGRPLSLVATRYPSDPPQVPTDAECIVQYRLKAETLDPANATAPTAPLVIMPAALTVEWTDPPAPKQGPAVPVATYQLVFRRDPTLPIGSYGLDSTTQRPPTKTLPTTNARKLPTDLVIPLAVQGPSDARTATISVSDLQAAGVLPPGATPTWRPESWRVYFQTISQNKVPSALAPVQLMLRVEADDGQPSPSNRREERRPAELEWLASPVKFPLLPPEDQAATVGFAHVPMPESGALWFDPAFTNVVRHAHPAGIRCIRFRWNQGPSGSPDYPLDLDAGFQLLELDADAHTTDTFLSQDKLAAALRPVQDVQMIPADELLLTPGDTLSPSQWEAWYPSAVQRRRDPASRAEGSTIPVSPWYSWRDSVLEWPAWSGLTAPSDPGIRDGAFHPALRRVLDLLENPPEGSGLAPHRLEIQASPASQPENLSAFLKATAPSADPYGWNALQRFGLSVAFRLRSADTGDVVGGASLLEALQAAFVFAGADVDAVDRHLHVEVLFQPGRAVALDDVAASPDDLVALVQLSLRPALRQTRRYGRLDLEGRPGDAIDVVLDVDPASSVSVVDTGDRAGGQLELVAADTPVSFRRTVRFPIGGRTALVFRGTKLPRIAVPLPTGSMLAPSFAGTPFQGHLRYVSSPIARIIVDTAIDRTDALSDALAVLLGGDVALAERILSIRVVSFAATDEQSTYFSIDPATLASDLAGDGDAGSQWTAFRRYAEALSSTDPSVPDDQKIAVPATKEEIEAIVPDFAAWSQRFFDASGAVGELAGPPPATCTLDGPWIATAYPRSGSPAQSAPDASGRLSYDHLLEDPWAHDYRYYVRPYGRYDLLWQSLRQSSVLFPGTPKLPEAAPEPTAGGLDVVLDRIRPIAKPLVLSSTRLDPPGSISSPAAPGATWEVIVAEHPEQALSEHNQTVARQLSFRQVAYTLLRSFAHPTWVDQLGAAATPPQAIALDLVEDHYPLPPAAYPATPEHLALTGPLSDDDARTLDLPLRLPSFQQGALALQWDALPFYYEHRLLLVAQSASTVSPINEIVQRDFQYRTPTPQASVGPTQVDWVPAPPFGAPGVASIPVRARKVHVSLRRLWESLPDSAQQAWPSEAPDGVHRKPAWLPDLGVVYELVELFSGNVSVQAEISFDEASGRFARRQIGTRFLADLGPLTAAGASGWFDQVAVVQQVTEQEVSRAYPTSTRDVLPPSTRAKVSFDGKVLSFVGVMTDADRDALLAVLDAADAPAIQSIHDGWYATVAISALPASIPPALADVLDLPEPTETPLVWEGPMSDAERAALLALPGDPEFLDAAARLASAVGTGNGVVSVSAPLGPEQIPAALQGRVALDSDPATGLYTAVRWSGNLSDVDADALEQWPRIRALADSVQTLAYAIETTSYSRPLPPARPVAEEFPAILQGRLLVGDTSLGWTGPAPTDAERAALAALAGDAAFLDARSRLLAAIDATAITSLGPVVQRPTQSSLPALLSAQLLIGATSLEWTGAAPTDDQRANLLALQGDRAFLAAVRDLLAALDAQTGTSVAMEAFVPRPAQSDLPAILQTRLLVGVDMLQWSSPAPSDAERSALDTLVADDALIDALAAILAAIDSDETVPMDPIARRPRQADLPDWLAGQLTLTGAEMVWTGRLHDESWRTFLLGLAGDPPFVEAVHEVVAAIDAQVVSSPFSIPVRPRPGALGVLEPKLLIGRAVLRYHGLMTLDEESAIEALFTRVTDLHAVARLFDATQSSGMRGRELRIRARRGTAPPSDLVSLTPITV